MARLEDTQDHEIRFWNTPNPPDLKNCAVDLVDLPPRCRLRVVDLGQCKTMSFFVANDSTFAVHGHAPTSRLAMDSQTTYDQLDHQVQSTTECLQVVLDGDRVTEFGILVKRDDMPTSQYMMGPGRSFVVSFMLGWLQSMTAMTDRCSWLRKSKVSLCLGRDPKKLTALFGCHKIPNGWFSTLRKIVQCALWDATHGLCINDSNYPKQMYMLENWAKTQCIEQSLWSCTTQTIRQTST